MKFQRKLPHPLLEQCVLMMDAAGSPETLVHSSQITQNPKDGIITGTGKL
jgi:hypothetical protein